MTYDDPDMNQPHRLAKKLSWNRTAIGLLGLAIWFLVFQKTLAGLFYLGLSDEGHSHVLVLPLMAGFFIFYDKKSIFKEAKNHRESSLWVAIFVLFGLFLSLLLIFFGDRLSSIDSLSLSSGSAISCFIGLLIVLLPGIRIKNSIFHISLLFMMVPIPSVVRERLVSFLVNGSSDITEMFFKLLGVTYYREGVHFLLSGLSIEVARECSGIRSSIGLFLTLLIASHMFLERWWSKGVLLTTVIPMVLVKNAIRITTLTLLALHVDIMFLVDSPLHRGGGVVFFAIALVLILPVLILLRKLEERRRVLMSGMRNRVKR